MEIRMKKLNLILHMKPIIYVAGFLFIKNILKYKILYNRIPECVNFSEIPNK